MKLSSNYLTSLIAGMTLIVAGSCGKKKDDDAATTPAASIDTSTLALGKIPDVSMALAGGKTATLMAVSGTPKKFSEIANTDISSGACKNWDKTIFGCAVSDVNTAGVATAAQRTALQRGEAVCRNIAETSNIMREMGGGSTCYMTKIPDTGTDTFQITKEGSGITAANYKDIFKPGATDRLVLIQPVVGGQVRQDIFVKVFAASTSSFKVEFSMCTSGVASGLDTFSLDSTTGLLTTRSVNSESNGSVRDRSATFYLKSDGAGGFIFDLTKDRVVTGSNKYSFSGNSNVAAYTVKLDKDNVLTNMNYATQNYTYNGVAQSGSHKIYAKTKIIGEDARSLRASEMGMAMVFNQGTNSFSPKGAVEWQDTTYANTTTSALYNDANAYAFTDAIFQTAPTAPTVTYAADACTRTPDVSAKFVMDSAGAKSVKAACDSGDNENLRNMYQLCNNADIQAARQKMFQ